MYNNSRLIEYIKFARAQPVVQINSGMMSSSTVKSNVSPKFNRGFFVLILALTTSPVESFRFLSNRPVSSITNNCKWPVRRSSIITRYSSPQPISDETMEEWLDDMIYCGDIEGYIRRRSKDVVTDDFREYLDERIAECQDEDEKQVLSEITLLLSEKLRLSDGMVDSEEVFESRLDKILFTAPNQRKAFIQENIGEMSLGLVEYVQREMKDTTDSDSKVVLASILQLIGQAKGSDLLGNMAALLAGADSSLGDQFAAPTSVLLGEGAGMSLSDAKEAGMKVGDKNEQVTILFVILRRHISHSHCCESCFTKLEKLHISYTGTKFLHCL